MIRVTCPGCHSLLDVRDELAGQIRDCPKCGGPLQIPKATPSAPPSTILVACPGCHSLLNVDKKLIGQTKSCPKCGGAVFIADIDSKLHSTIQVTCPGCKSVVNARDDLAGQIKPCPKCGGPLRIPLPDYEARTSVTTEKKHMSNVLDTALQQHLRGTLDDDSPLDEEVVEEEAPTEEEEELKEPKESWLTVLAAVAAVKSRDPRVILTVLAFVFVGTVYLTIGRTSGAVDESPVARVEGKVLYRGEPLMFGSVTFQPEVGPPAKGRIQSDGTFRLSTYGNGDGAIIGRHQVRIVCYENQAPGYVKPESGEEGAGPKSLIPSKYASWYSSGLRRTVGASNSPFVFDLTDDE